MNDVAYRTADVDGLTVFYREAGPAGPPVLVLLHGFRRDIPDADVRFVPTGHFALETHVAEIAAAVREFLSWA